MNTEILLKYIKNLNLNHHGISLVIISVIDLVNEYLFISFHVISTLNRNNETF